MHQFVFKVLWLNLAFLIFQKLFNLLLKPQYFYLAYWFFYTLSWDCNRFSGYHFDIQYSFRKVQLHLNFYLNWISILLNLNIWMLTLIWVIHLKLITGNPISFRKLIACNQWSFSIFLLHIYNFEVRITNCFPVWTKEYFE